MKRRFTSPRLLVVATTAALAVLAVLSTDAGAAGPPTQIRTEHVHGEQSIVVWNPCSGAPIDLTASTNLVFHETSFGGVAGISADAEEDRLVGVEERTGVVYSGHRHVTGELKFTAGDGVSTTEVETSTQTSGMRLVGSDGTSLYGRGVLRITVTLPTFDTSIRVDNGTIDNDCA